MPTAAENKARFQKLCQQSPDDQMEIFLKSFIFALGDNWKDLAKLNKEYRKYLEDSDPADRGKPDLNVVQASNFLQKHGLARSAQQRSDEIKDIDLDGNGRISFIEYLLLHYKAMVLSEYSKRTHTPPPKDIDNQCIGVIGVGDQLLDELFTLPMGLDPELEKAIEEFMAQKRAKEQKVKDLEVKAAAGGVKGLAAKNEIEQINNEDNTQTNKLELTLNAAKKKAGKESGEVALKKKLDAEAAEKKKQQDESKARLAAKASLWESK
eukprot:TRINITY_DN635_c0_g1_i1.p1 TRINITY_DN635_c0_g1~~TRINITY_DN635_c0_g1_i1.p1  ORF type:complete len:266 (-),score=111.07 TRINITY_DN635_c0_g1_i1:99-896(-)